MLCLHPRVSRIASLTVLHDFFRVSKLYKYISDSVSLKQSVM